MGSRPFLSAFCRKMSANDAAMTARACASVPPRRSPRRMSPMCSRPSSRGSGVCSSDGGWETATRGRARLIALIEQASVIQRILRHLGLPTEVPASRRCSGRPEPCRRAPLFEAGSFERGQGSRGLRPVRLTVAPGAGWPEVRPSLVLAMAGRAERSSGGALSLDTSAAAAIISPVPGRRATSGGRRRCLIPGLSLTPRAETPFIRTIVQALQWRRSTGCSASMPRCGEWSSASASRTHAACFVRWDFGEASPGAGETCACPCPNPPARCPRKT